MTRKDYILIAKAISAALDYLDDGIREGGIDIADDAHGSISIVIDQLAIALAADNPRFHADRFRLACKTGREKHLADLA